MSNVNLRGRKAAVLNAPDHEVPELRGQLARIGISVSMRTKLDRDELRDLDFMFVHLPEASGLVPVLGELKPGQGPICVVILDSESPTVLERLGKVEADAVIVRPIRPLGLLATLAHAQTRRARMEKLHDKVVRLERKLQSFRNVEDAKGVLAGRHGVSTDQAFAILRRHAMQERSTIEQVAETILSANRLLSIGSELREIGHKNPKTK